MTDEDQEVMAVEWAFVDDDHFVLNVYIDEMIEDLLMCLIFSPYYVPCKQTKDMFIKS